MSTDKRRSGHRSAASPADTLPDQSIDVTAELLRRGVPLTLLADLLSPFGPDSDRILEEERDAEDRQD